MFLSGFFVPLPCVLEWVMFLLYIVRIWMLMNRDDEHRDSSMMIFMRMTFMRTMIVIRDAVHGDGCDNDDAKVDDDHLTASFESQKPHPENPECPEHHDEDDDEDDIVITSMQMI